MADPVETSINRMVGDKFCSIYTGEKKFVEELRQYAKEYPGEVKMKSLDGGYVEAEVPFSWFKFVRPKRKYNMSDEQRQAAAERLARTKEQKKSKESEI